MWVNTGCINFTKGTFILSCLSWLCNRLFFFFASNLSSSGTRHLGSFFATEKQKHLAHDIMCTAAMPAITVMTSQTWSNLQHSRTFFRAFQMLILSKLDHKTTVSVFFILFLLKGPAMLFSLWPLLIYFSQLTILHTSSAKRVWSYGQRNTFTHITGPGNVISHFPQTTITGVLPWLQ